MFELDSHETRSHFLTRNVSSGPLGDAGYLAQNVYKKLYD